MQKKHSSLLRPKNWPLALCLLLAAISFSSCDDDDWLTREFLCGEWRIVEVSPGYGPCPYRYNDYFQFYYDGQFEAVGYDLHEEARWDVGHDIIMFDYDYDGRTDATATIDRLDGRYARIYVNDNWYGSTYTIRMVKTRDY
ncbi:MAG: hypothetical protein MR624_00865 [Bacteroidales bacterium]|nr:hypothetical protein [Bacteroidales bacterium]